MGNPKPSPPTADGAPIPSKLKLAFSKAADNGRLAKMFDPAIKSKVDPHNFVVKREKSVFDETVAKGRAAFLYDPATGEAHTLTMSYHVNDKASGDHVYSEIGTSITRIMGFKSAQIVIAALVLKEWWNSPPSDHIITEILPDNQPSLHLYRDSLGWTRVTDQDKVDEMHRLCNEYIAPEDKGRQTQWFYCGNSVLPKMAAILLEFLDSEKLSNKYTQQEIDLDLSELEKNGLTRARLEAIAKGVTSKNMLQGSNPAPCSIYIWHGMPNSAKNSKVPEIIQAQITAQW